MIIAIDFDGTIVKHEYPKVGEPNPMAIDYIKRFQDEGAHIILWTMRSGEHLDDAVSYLEDNGIKLLGVNTNPSQKVWTNSPKAYANLYIDDAGFNCPLAFPKEGKPYVNWGIVGPKVLRMLREGKTVHA